MYLDEKLVEQMRPHFNSSKSLRYIMDYFDNTPYFKVLAAWVKLNLDSGNSPGSTIKGASIYGFGKDTRVIIHDMLKDKIHRPFS